jgi:hypothetical protein
MISRVWIGPDEQSSRAVRHAVIATAFLFLFGVVVGPAVARWVGSRHTYRPSSVEASVFEDKTGIRLVRVGVTAGGGLVEVQYQILDPSKAIDTLHLQAATGAASGSASPQSIEPFVSAHNHQAVSLVDERSGLVLNQSFHYSSAARGDLRAGGTYYQMLVNSRDVLTAGSLVTVVMGDDRLRHVAAA